MPRAIWTGAISFGLVTVPVKVYSAIERKTVRFHQLSAKTGVRVVQRRVDPQTGDEVPYEDIVKGYELAPDRYVVIEPGELDTLEPTKTRTIEIEDFVQLSEIDPIYYDHPYYLVPGTGGAKPYRLLLQAMHETGKVGIARVVMRSKEQLVAVRPMGDVLGMATMLFGDEVLSPERLDEAPEAAGVKVTKRELEVAGQLVESLAGQFEPDKYRDTYREQVLGLIERKAQGKKIALQPPSEEVAPAAPDLMGALKASLEAVKRARAGRRGPQTQAVPGQSARQESAGQETGRQETGLPAGRRQAVGAGATRCRQGAALQRRKARELPRQTRLQGHARAAAGRRAARRRAALRRPRAPRAQPALGSAPRARRRARLLGDPQGHPRGAQGNHLAATSRTIRWTTWTSTARSPRAVRSRHDQIWDSGTYDARSAAARGRGHACTASA